MKKINFTDEKSKRFRKLTALLMSICLLFCTVSVGAAENNPVQEDSDNTIQKGDLNHDGMLGMDDARLLIKAILKIVAMVDIYAADTDNDDKLTFNDVQLIVNTVLGEESITSTLPVKPIADLPDVVGTLEQTGEKEYQYTVSLENESRFYALDYGVMFDSKNLKCKSISAADCFQNAFRLDRGRMASFEKGANYVVFGCATCDPISYQGDLFIITFEKIGETPGDLTIIKNSSSVNPDDVEPLDPPVTDPTVKQVKGDVDGDGMLSTEDARLALQGALKILKLDENRTYAADIDADGSISFHDATQILNAVLGEHAFECSLPVKETEHLPDVKGTFKKVGEKEYKYIVSLEQAADITSLDYGIVFDSQKLKCTSVSLGGSLSSALYRNWGIHTLFQREDNYIVFGCVMDQISCKGELLVIEFEQIGDTPGTLAIVKNAASVNPDEVELPDESENPPILDLPPIPVEQREAGDINGDGMIGMDDAQFVLKVLFKIISISGDYSRLVDVDQDQKITSNDIQVIMNAALGENLLGNNLPAKKITDLPEAVGTLKKTGEREYQYTVSLENQSNFYALDYGIMFDSQNLKCKSIRVNSYLQEKLKNTREIGNIFSAERGANYVVFGCVAVDPISYQGDLFVITFEQIGDTPGDVAIIKNSASVNPDEVKPLDPPVTDPTVKRVKGDVDGDGMLSAEDARLALQGALKIMKLNEYEMYAADIDEDGSLSFDDANEILNAVLGERSFECTLPVKGIENLPDAKGTFKKVGEKEYKYIVSLEQAADITSLDYGIVFDSQKLKCTSVSLGRSFSSALYRNWGIHTLFQREDNYIVFGCVMDQISCKGELLVIEFEQIGDTPGTLAIVKNAASVNPDDVELPDESENPPILDLPPIPVEQREAGDINGDGMIGMDDAQFVLKVLLKIISPSGEPVDVDQDRKITSNDVQLILKAVLGENILGNELPAKKMTDLPDAVGTLKKTGEKEYQYTVSLEDASKFYSLDYGVVYDPEKLKCKSIRVNSYLQRRLDNENDYGNVLSLERKANYAVFGCVAMEPISYQGDLFVITFEQIGDTPGTLAIVKNSANVNPDEVKLPIEPQESVKPQDSQRPQESIKPQDSQKPQESIKPQDSQKPQQSTKPQDSAKPQDSQKPQQSIKPQDSQKPQQSTKPQDSAKPQDSQKPQQSIKPQDSQKPQQSVKPQDSQKPQDTEDPTREVIKETIKNDDGTTTNRVIERGTSKDGTKYETVTDTTEGNDGSIKETVTKTVTQTDGSKLIKIVDQVSKQGEAGEIVKTTWITDEKKDSSGKTVEKYEYAADTLPPNVEWNTTIVEQLSETQKETLENSNKRARDHMIFNIIPTSDGNKPNLSNGNVKISLFAGNRWKDKRIRVFDFEKEMWLDASVDGEYISFSAQHFNLYAVSVIQIKKGDVNNDGKVSLDDASITLRAALRIVNLNEDDKAAADLDSDGKISLDDASNVLKMALKIIPTVE